MSSEAKSAKIKSRETYEHPLTKVSPAQITMQAIPLFLMSPTCFTCCQRYASAEMSKLWSPLTKFSTWYIHDTFCEFLLPDSALTNPHLPL